MGWQLDAKHCDGANSRLLLTRDYRICSILCRTFAIPGSSCGASLTPKATASRNYHAHRQWSIKGVIIVVWVEENGDLDGRIA
jgi:hypothetical protein